MATREEVLRKDLTFALRIAELVRRNLSNANTPIEVAYWVREFNETRDEVMRLTRALKNGSGAP